MSFFALKLSEMNLFALFRRTQNEVISGSVVDLKMTQVYEANRSNHYVPSYFYDIYLHNTNKRVGYCDLRVGYNQELYYAGNIGYHVDPPYRGHHYAYEACRMLFQVALDKGMDTVIITCSPDNPASRKTLERLDGCYIETVAVPEDHWLYQRGETIKRIYRYDLNKPAL